MYIIVSLRILRLSRKNFSDSRFTHLKDIFTPKDRLIALTLVSFPEVNEHYHKSFFRSYL